eukprot:ANDGO_00246.mRNA.1 3'
MPNQPVVSPSPTSGSGDPHKPHVLVVDDDPTVLSTISRMLNHIGYEVHATASGSDAARMLSDLPRIDAALLDVFMPGMGGLELLRIMRSARRRDLSVLMMSSSEDPETVRQCFRGGAEDFLQKPISRETLQRRLSSALAERDAKRREKSEQRRASDDHGTPGSLVSGAGSFHNNSSSSMLNSNNSNITGGNANSSSGSGMMDSSESGRDDLKSGLFASTLAAVEAAVEMETPLQGVMQYLLEVLLDEGANAEDYRRTIIAALKSLSETDLYKPTITRFLQEVQDRRTQEGAIDAHIADWILYEFTHEQDASASGRRTSLAPQARGNASKFQNGGSASSEKPIAGGAGIVASRSASISGSGIPPVSSPITPSSGSMSSAGVSGPGTPTTMQAPGAGLTSPNSMNTATTVNSVSVFSYGPSKTASNSNNAVPSPSNSPLISNNGLPPGFSVDEILSCAPGDVTSFGYDVLALTDTQLIAGVVEMFRHLGLLEKFSIPPAKLALLVGRLKGLYHQNPYHNFHHAMDVTQFVFSVLANADNKLTSVLGSLDQLALLVSALFHDADHPGVNNNFQINSRSRLALLYNDISVLENHHCALAFSMLSDEAVDILTGLDPADWRECRKLVVSCILATDMSRHFELMSRFRTRLSAAQLGTDSKDDKNLLMNVILKCADISNVVRPFRVYEKWVRCLTAEFFNQGDAEKTLHIPVSPLMDRDTTSIPEMQFNFIEFVAGPLHRALAQEIPQLKEVIQNMEFNREVFRHRIQDPNFGPEDLLKKQRQDAELLQQQLLQHQQQLLAQQQEQAHLNELIEPISAEPIVNMELALDLCDSDEELLKEMLGDLLDRGEAHIRKAEDAFQRDDWEVLHREAHTLKGSAATLACHPLRDAADIVSRAAREKKSAEIPRSLLILKSEFERFKKHTTNVLHIEKR